MTIKEIYKYCIDELKDKEENIIDTEILIAYVLKENRLYLKMNLDKEISENQEKQIRKLIKQLKDNKPIHYITKIRDFYGFDFEVCEGVLIPRSDTEILVEKSLEILKKCFNGEILGLEIGVGTGIISISLLKQLKNLKMLGIDINTKALEITQKNAEIFNVDDRLQIINSDLFNNLKNEKFDFIISNPPYISGTDIETLPEKIKNYEPLSALYADENGLYYYRKILKEAKKYLKNNFCIFFEIGYNQAQDVKIIFKENGFLENVQVIKDLSGKDRAIIYCEFN